MTSAMTSAMTTAMTSVMTLDARPGRELTSTISSLGREVRQPLHNQSLVGKWDSHCGIGQLHWE